MADARLALLILALPFLGSLVAAFLPARARNWASILAGAVTLGALALLFGFYRAVSNGITVRYIEPWLPSLGLDFTFRITGFSWLFALLILGIGALGVL